MPRKKQTTTPAEPETGTVAAEEPQQVPLIPTVPVQTRVMMLDARNLDPGNARPSAGLRRSIADLDTVLVPIIVMAHGDGYRILGGRRRVAAAQAVQAKQPGRPFPIPALLITNAHDLGPGLPSVVTLLENELRSESPAVELRELLDLVKQGYSEHDIALATGMPAQTIRKRLRLATLLPRLLDAWEHGKMADGVAEDAAKLTQTQQETLAEKLDAKLGYRLTGQDVADVKKVARASAAGQVPASLFAVEAEDAVFTARVHALEPGEATRNAIGSAVRAARAEGIDRHALTKMLLDAWSGSHPGNGQDSGLVPDESETQSEVPPSENPDPWPDDDMTQQGGGEE